jgi:uncharacterized protein (TIGR03435 family)
LAIAIGLSRMSVIAALAFGQNPQTAPSFQVADVHVSPRVSERRWLNMQGGVFRAGRYEIHDASMLDLVKTAYGVDADTVVGGPAWLEFDRFDVIAKAPPATSPQTIKLMLQALLADRFKLVVHRDTRPIQGFVLSALNGKPKLKEAGGSGEPGCQPQPPSPRSPGSIPVNVVSCRNVTMEEFAPMLRQMVQEFGPTSGQAASYLTGPVLNSTGLKGAWDFDLKWTSKGLLRVPGNDGVTIFDAVDKQLGLKLEPGKVPMPVLVVDRANENPTPNSPGVTTALPPPPPVEFEVASVRPSKPGTDEDDWGQFLAGGRYEAHGVPLFGMLTQAWDINRVPGDFTGAPKWLTIRDSPRFDIVAKAPPAAIAVGEGHGVYDLQSMMRALLVDRFKMKAHYEDRPMDAYTLVADKPKLKRADPSNRTACKTARAPRAPEGPPPPMIATCQNVTTAQFAEQLQTIAPIYLYYPVLDASGIAGSWDISLSFSPAPPNLAGGGGGNGASKGGGKGGGAAAGVSSDPSGAVSLFDAMEKQLGLKLEVHQRPEPVLVIDHIEESPTDN